MRTASCKAKGRRLQQYIRDKILEYFPNLTTDDVRSTSMGAGGEDVLFSPTARSSFPYSIEAKNTEKIAIWQAIEQAERNAGKHNPLVVFSRNRSKTYAVIEFDHLVELRAAYQNAMLLHEQEMKARQAAEDALCKVSFRKYNE